MTLLGEYLAKKSINQSKVARKTGLDRQRINQLYNNKTSRLTVEEFCLIMLAIDVNPSEALKTIFGFIKLPS
ncbi:MAG TPA: helix-turn-helix transcriptional regulator [Arachidicoccus sp.]|nr:helix-turn-helix transcriptional regulator [Arachidicoccus sp.]